MEKTQSRLRSEFKNSEKVSGVFGWYNNSRCSRKRNVDREAKSWTVKRLEIMNINSGENDDNGWWKREK